MAFSKLFAAFMVGVMVGGTVVYISLHASTLAAHTQAEACWARADACVSLQVGIVSACRMRRDSAYNAFLEVSRDGVEWHTVTTMSLWTDKSVKATLYDKQSGTPW